MLDGEPLRVCKGVVQMDVTIVEQELTKALPDDEVMRDEPLSAHTTFRIGGPADFFVTPRNVQGVAAAIDVAKRAQVPFYVMGCGSNILVADEGLRGIVIHIGERMSAIEIDGQVVAAQAGATNEQVSRAACGAGLSGYEFACGIPGSIGGAAIMNAGAYDGQFADVACSVTCLDADGTVVEVDRDQAEWGYRHSMMSERGYIVLGARLLLAPDDPARIAERMADLTARREEKQPLDLGSAGSTFKRPEGYFAGKLIDDAGMRGHRVGDAMVSEKHCGFVVNAGNATAAQVRQVIADVQDAVYATVGVRLETEVRMWGF